MGHHTTSKSSIAPLIDRLNKYPIGLIENEELRQILAILFSNEEAKERGQHESRKGSLQTTESTLSPFIFAASD